MRGLWESSRVDFFGRTRFLSSAPQVLLQLLEYHGRLDAVAAREAFAAAVGGRDGVQAIPLGGLRVDYVLEFGQVARSGAEELLLERHLEHDVGRFVARGSREGRFLFSAIEKSQVFLLVIGGIAM